MTTLGSTHSDDLTQALTGGQPLSLADSHAWCEQVTRAEAKNFYYGMKLTPGEKRAAMYGVYAWMRLADDLADEAGEEAAKIIRIEQFWQLTQQVIDPDRTDADALSSDGKKLGGCWPAFREITLRYAIPADYLEAMVKGQLLDQQTTRYATFDELYAYCYKVASVVGLTCITIWGYDGDEETRQLAEWRGIAFQLTNILRDIREDAERDRIYLPAEDFDEPLTPELLLSGDRSLVTGIEETIWRAREYYEKSAPLDELVHPDGRACLWAMTRIYRGLLDKIETDPPAVLRARRIRLSPISKSLIALRARWMARRRER